MDDLDKRLQKYGLRVSDEILDIASGGEKKIDEQTLIGIITSHFHQQRKKLKILNGISIAEGATYTLEIAAEALGMTRQSLSVLGSPTQGRKITITDSRVSGYEIIRYDLRRKIPKGYMPHFDIAKLFSISQSVVLKCGS